jgi:hypothetical protein
MRRKEGDEICNRVKKVEQDSASSMPVSESPRVKRAVWQDEDGGAA